MKGKKIILEFSEDWVLSCKDNNFFPVQCFIDKLKSIYYENNITIIEQSVVSCIVLISFNDSDSLTMVEKRIKNSIIHMLSLARRRFDETIQKYNVIDIDLSDNKNENGDTYISCDDSKRENNNNGQSKEKEVLNKIEKKPYDNEIDALIDAERFKALIEKIKSVGPFYAEKGLESVFCSTNFLFSINDGYGISTYLRILTNVLYDLNLIESNVYKRITPHEEKDLESAMNKVKDIEIPAVRALFYFDLSNINISRQSFTFQALSKHINANDSKILFIFRIPYVENRRLKEIEDTFKDLTNIKTITFVPSTDRSLFDFAKKRLKDFGFYVEDGCYNIFSKLLWSERRDGNFYGFNTVEKIVNQLIYEKIQEEELNTTTDVSKKDFDRLLKGNQYDESVDFSDLIGMEKVEKKVEEIIASIAFQRSAVKEGKSISVPCMHMMFTGNPGCGKTTVARIIGRKLREAGILSVGNFIEISGRDLVGRYIGETAPKTAQICRDAYGSVLFIDEAYSLAADEQNYSDYGREALTTLIGEMENHRENMVVILAGYKDDMERLLNTNVGLRDRVPHHIHFENYNREELNTIFIDMAEHSFSLKDGFKELSKKYFDGIDDKSIKDKMFSNGRMVRNLYERVWSKAALRFQMDDSLDKSVLIENDLEKAINDADFSQLTMKQNTYKIGF